MSQIVEIMGINIVSSEVLINRFYGVPILEKEYIDYDKASGLNID